MQHVLRWASLQMNIKICDNTLFKQLTKPLCRMEWKFSNLDPWKAQNVPYFCLADSNLGLGWETTSKTHVGLYFINVWGNKISFNCKKIIINLREKYCCGKKHLYSTKIILYSTKIFLYTKKCSLFLYLFTISWFENQLKRTIGENPMHELPVGCFYAINALIQLWKRWHFVN